MLEEEQKELPKGVFRDKLLIMCIPITVPCLNLTETRETLENHSFSNVLRGSLHAKVPCCHTREIMELIGIPQFRDFEGFHNTYSPRIAT